MQITIEVPSGLRQYCNGAREIRVSDSTNFPTMIMQLSAHYPGLTRRIVAPGGGFYDFVGVFLNQKSLAGTASDEIKLQDGDVVSLIPAMAGG